MKDRVISADQIQDAVDYINSVVGVATGVIEVRVLIRVVNQLMIYVIFDPRVIEESEADLIYPHEAKLKYEKPSMNSRKFPRIWLEEAYAETKCLEYLIDKYPDLNMEWVAFVKNADNSISLIPN